MTDGPSYRLVMATAVSGMFLSTLDTGIVNIALPTLGRQFDVTPALISLTVTLYIAALCATILLFGRLGDYLGQVRLYSAGLVVFAVGSLLCGSSLSAPMLIGSRMVQGIGAAMVQAVTAALITTLVPSQRRGTALGTLGLILGLGPVLGPTVGGFLISTVGWRWIFFINLPVCLAGCWGCWRLQNELHDVETAQSESLSADGVGTVIFAVGIVALFVGFSGQLSRLFPRGTSVAFGVFVVSFVVFVLWEHRVSNPLVNLRLLRTPSFGVPFLTIGAVGASATVAFIVPPYFLERVTHLASWQAGLVVFTGPMGLLIFAQLSGVVMNRIGLDRVMVSGLVMMTVGLLTLSTMQSDWSPLLLGGVLFFWGAGSGLFLPANTDAIMRAVSDARQGTAGSMQRMNQNLFSGIGAATTGALISAHIGRGTPELMIGLQQSWLVATGIVVVSLAAVVGRILSKRHATEEPTVGG